MKILLCDGTSGAGCVPGRYPHTSEDARSFSQLMRRRLESEGHVVAYKNDGYWIEKAIIDWEGYLRDLEPLKKEGAPISSFGGLVDMVSLGDWKNISPEQDATHYREMFGFTRQKHAEWQLKINEIYRANQVYYDLAIISGYGAEYTSYLIRLLDKNCRTVVVKSPDEDWFQVWERTAPPSIG